MRSPTVPERSEGIKGGNVLKLKRIYSKAQRKQEEDRDIEKIGDGIYTKIVREIEAA